VSIPVPTLDHVVINVRDRIDAGADTYRRLGFTLTPRGYHTLGSMNHLAMFGTDYLELIAAPAGTTQRPEILQQPDGLNGLVFGSEDSTATYEAVKAAGVPIEPPRQFSRPVELPDGPHDATFRTVSLIPGTVSAGRLYFCHHLTRDLVWRDEWRHHANGVIGIARAVVAARDPAVLGALFAQMFGAGAVRAIDGGCVLAVGLSRFEVLTHAALRRAFGDAAADGGGREDFMAALSFRTRSVEMAAAALKQGNVDFTRHDGRLLVSAASAFGAAMEFVGCHGICRLNNYRIRSASNKVASSSAACCVF
jgi:catechol 2,3-dioxygenase-like lactoylglutathione lyase family enzyme